MNQKLALMFAVVGQGAILASATTYTYKYPTYVVEMAAGASNTLDKVENITKYESDADTTGTAATYEEFSVAATGSLVKRGAGILTLDKSLNDYGGEVHIEEGVLIACCSNALGSTGSSTKTTYVHDGATLVADNKGVVQVQDMKTYRYEGEGAPGLGGALVFRSEGNFSSYWLWQVASRPTGDATVFFDLPNGASAATTYSSDANNNKHATDLRLEGKTMFFHGRTPGSRLYLNASQMQGINYLVVSNMTLELAGNSAALNFTGTNPQIRWLKDSRYCISKFQSINKTETWHTGRFVVDGLEYMQLARTDVSTNNGAHAYADLDQKKNWWHGTVELNTDLRVYNSKGTLQGFTLAGKVTGPAGIRSWHNASGVNKGNNVYVNLMGTENDFKGGVVLNASTLLVWRNGAVPAQDDAGLVSITNGTIAFCKQPTRATWDVYGMPTTEFVGSGTVTNGTGRWRALVKKGSGTLDYNSQLDGDVLDLQDGTVRLNSAYRANYADEAGFTASVPKFDVLRGTVGTLDVNGLAEVYEVERLEDTPSVDNADVRVKDGWAVSAAALKAGTVATFSGTLSFDSGATVSVTDVENLPSRNGGYVLARANAITGFTPHASGPFCALVDSDGKTLRVKRTGLQIIMR